MPGKRQTAAEMKTILEEWARRSREAQETWMSRAEEGAKGTLEAKGASESQRRDARYVLGYKSFLLKSLKAGDHAGVAYWGCQIGVSYERMRWRPFEEPAARALGKGILWGPCYLELTPLPKRIAEHVKKHPKGTLHDLFWACWTPKRP